MGLFSAIKNIFKSSGDDTSSSCCADGVCTCGAAEQADEVINELLQDKRSNVVNPDGSFEEVRNETQPGREQASTPPPSAPAPKNRKPRLSQKQKIEQEMEKTATAINDALEHAAEADRNDASTATHVNKAPKTATKKPKATTKKATAKKTTTTKAKTTKKRSTAKKAK